MTPAAAEVVRAAYSPQDGAIATVLTVDDEAPVLSALRRLLRSQGLRILQATSGADGLALLGEHDVDLVISDMRMPQMDGARFLEQVRLRSPSTMRILLTGYADIGATIAAVNRGEIHRYIAKPWEDADLLLVVREALARRQLEQRNAELTALTQAQNTQLLDANRTLESRVAERTAELAQVNGMLEAAFGDLDRTFMLSVKVFTGLLEMREGSAGHSRRVAELARRTALRLGCSERDVRDVHLGALLHDVGKIGFPDRMLGRPVSTFTAEEMQRYRHHPLDGETALMPLLPLQGASRVVRQHHERFDGKGFPDGLQGEDICLGARIVAAASDYDGLVQGVAAEVKYSPERARQMLRGGCDTRYDRRVVEALLEVLAAIDLAEQTDQLIDVRVLRAGMVLARDLTAPNGSILLAAGYVFDERVIRQVTDFANRERLRLTLYVRREPGAAAPPAAADTTADAYLQGVHA